jgi:hypothetical protein
MNKVTLLLWVIAVLCFSNLSFSQLLYEENFNYSGPLLSNGWQLSGTNVTNPEATVTPGLTFTNYPSVTGNACALANTGQDVYATFTADSSTSVYLSFLVNVSAVLTGDYFIAMSAPYSQTNYYCRIFLKSATGGFNVGVSKSNENAAGAMYGPTALALNTTYLIVAKYQFVPGDSNDVISVWTFANGTLPATEPSTGEVMNYSTNLKADNGSIGIVTLRQGTSTSAPTLTIDGIRVQKSWVGTIVPVELTSFSAAPSNGGIRLSWNTATELNNLGFNIDRSTDKSQWSTIGFVSGHQTTSSANNYSFVDKAVSLAGKYYYRLKQVDNNGIFKYSHIVETELPPVSFALNQNYPNPFNPSTVISYSLPQASNVKLTVYNALGQPVSILENGFKSAGTYKISFNASQLSTGAYFYKIEAGQFSQIRKMLLVK